MALKSSREGLRKELVDYLGNIIIDENLKQNIINSIGDVFIDNEELLTSVNELGEKIRNEASARESADNALQNSINLETTARQEAVTNIEDLINNGTLKMDLLWTNATPNSMFAPQTISLDLSKYKLISIYYFYENNGRYNKQAFFKQNISNEAWLDFLIDTSNYSCRLINSIKDNGIVFGPGLRNGSSDNNSFCIPYQIYGVR